MDINKIIRNIKKEPKIFKNKAELDHYIVPSTIIERDDKATELTRFVIGYKKGYVPNVVSVYGRSGSGKSCIVRKVCEELGKMESDFEYVYVNLRECKSAFTAANLVLQELGEENISKAVGLDFCFAQIERSILKRKGAVKCIIIILDEFDSLLSDARNKASNFIYKFLTLQEKLRKTVIISIITISNNLLSNYDLDDRVKSRMGGAEVYFDPYEFREIYEILKRRASKAFVKGAISKEMLEQCSLQSGIEHGDARRSIDLLRFAAEAAVRKRRRKITIEDVKKAEEMMQEDTVKRALEDMPFHSKEALLALCDHTFVYHESWVSTSQVYQRYRKYAGQFREPVTYRRLSDILKEFEDSGLCISRKISRGRHGFGKEYKLTVPPETILRYIPEYFKKVKEEAHNKELLDLYSKILKHRDNVRSAVADYERLRNRLSNQ